MEIDKKKQAQALAKAKSILSDAEKKREANRVEKGVQLFLKGRFDTLYNDELVENLASYILNKYILDEKQAACEILEKIGESLASEDVAVRERSLMILSVFSEIIIEEDFKDLQEILSGILVDWLQAEDEFVSGFESLCSQLQKIILKMLYSEQWLEVESHLAVLKRMAAGDIKKPQLIGGMVVKLYENLAEPDILDNLVQVYLDENDDRREAAEKLLIHFGRFTAMFLIQKMIYSSSKDERFQLIELIPRVGEVTVPVLVACLEENPQWFVIRNVIFIISRLEDSELYAVVEPYLTYNDIRVQQQVISCIEMLGGTQMRKRLVEALLLVNDDLKGQIVNQLGQYSDSDVGEAYLSLLENRKNIARHIQDDLVLKLCIRIKFFPSTRAVSCLQDLVHERRQRYGERDRIVTEAAASLQTLELNAAGHSQNGKSPEESRTEPGLSTERDGGAVTGIEVSDDDEETLFSSDEMDHISAGGDISETLTASASDEAADQSGKSAPDDVYSVSRQQHLMIWSKLYEQMDADEADQFFKLLKTRTYKADDEIVSRGDKVTDMFFIDSGIAGLAYVSDDKSEITLTSLQTGDLIGSEGMIEERTWTVSFSAQTTLRVRVLDRKSFKKLAEHYSALTEELHYYCNHYDVLPYLLNLTEKDSAKPIGEDLTVNTTMPLLRDSSGAAVASPAAGALQFIACGGYCFTLPYVHENNAESILGRQVASLVRLSDGEEKKCFGVIAGAGSHSRDDQELFVYVKFYHPLIKAEYDCPVVDIM